MQCMHTSVVVTLSMPQWPGRLCWWWWHVIFLCFLDTFLSTCGIYCSDHYTAKQFILPFVCVSICEVKLPCQKLLIRVLRATCTSYREAASCTRLAGHESIIHAVDNHVQVLHNIKRVFAVPGTVQGARLLKPQSLFGMLSSVRAADDTTEACGVVKYNASYQTVPEILVLYG